MDIDTSLSNTHTIIGLDVKGSVFFCQRSELIAANDGCSYFSARFRLDSMLDPGLDRIDDEGREIYKLNHNIDPFVFQQVMEYIDTKKKPNGIGSYDKNRNLWRLLREEADYFGLSDLVKMLNVTFSCSPSANGTQGVLYWLGTMKGTTNYINPYERGDVTITGSFDKPTKSRMGHDDIALMVQHRPNPEGESMFTPDEIWTEDHIDWLLSGDINNEGGSKCTATFLFFSKAYGPMMGENVCYYEKEKSEELVVLKLKKGIAVSPTHYSIRNGGNGGMSGDWNFEASVDGLTWVVIHESRGRSPLFGGLLYPWHKQQHRKVWYACQRVNGTKKRKLAVLEYMEHNQRHTWKVDTTGDFYTQFRIVSIPVQRRRSLQYSLFGIGLEIYGHVLES